MERLTLSKIAEYLNNVKTLFKSEGEDKNHPYEIVHVKFYMPKRDRPAMVKLILVSKYGDDVTLTLFHNINNKNIEDILKSNGFSMNKLTGITFEQFVASRKVESVEKFNNRMGFNHFASDTNDVYVYCNTLRIFIMGTSFMVLDVQIDESFDTIEDAEKYLWDEFAQHEAYHLGKEQEIA